MIKQALGRGGDDPDEARREELEQRVLARKGGAVAKRVLPGCVAMGKSFESVRMGAKEVLARWLKASRALKKEDGSIYGQRPA
jgi:hypothetical protein